MNGRVLGVCEICGNDAYEDDMEKPWAAALAAERRATVERIRAALAKLYDPSTPARDYWASIDVHAVLDAEAQR
jgi:hypothetical protein